MSVAGRPDDPVLRRRELYRRWSDLGQKIGYLLFGLAIVVFLIGVFVGLTDTMVAVIVAALVSGSVVLAPAIVFGYAVKAADRDDADPR